MNGVCDVWFVREIHKRNELDGLCNIELVVHWMVKERKR